MREGCPRTVHAAGFAAEVLDQVPIQLNLIRLADSLGVGDQESGPQVRYTLSTCPGDHYLPDQMQGDQFFSPPMLALRTHLLGGARWCDSL